MAFPAIPLIGLAGKIIDLVIPDPKARSEAKHRLAELEQNGELKQVGLQLRAIIVEAQSNDAWTSRARPSFMYVVYLYLLSALPFGLVFAFYPERAGAITNGVAEWLAAMPGEMWTLFGVGYLGYTGARTLEKRKLIDKASKASPFDYLKDVDG